MVKDAFSGFPAGKQPLTRLPDAIFTHLLPLVDDLAELKVTLHVYWLLAHKLRDQQYVGQSELAMDATLMQGLHLPGMQPAEALQQGLERAVARGSLLQVSMQGEQTYYFPNSQRGRRAVHELEAGERVISGMSARAQITAPRPTIYLLYEQNIGPVPPLLADELADAEHTYPPTWIEDAFREAVHLNKRSWRYVYRILERWATEGKDDGTVGRDRTEDAGRDLAGKYADYVEY